MRMILFRSNGPGKPPGVWGTSLTAPVYGP
jgi:hypothetical protein